MVFPLDALVMKTTPGAGMPSSRICLMTFNNWSTVFS